MTATLTRDLEPLTSSGLELADPAMDLRGREVRDRDGEQVGTVEDMLVDPALRVPRMVEVATGGGLLGLGKKHHLIPMEAISGGDPRTVYVDKPKDEILAAPEYTPAEGDEEEAHYSDVYAYFALAPYWTQEAQEQVIGMRHEGSSMPDDRTGST